MDKKNWKRRLIIAGSSAAALVLAVLGGYLLWERPPELAAGNPVLTELNQSAETPAAPASPASSPSPTPDRGTAFETARQDGVYTLLVAGSDDGTGNTDTIMVGRLDTVHHTANFVSIPRDTLINIDSPIRKINGVYWTAVYSGASGSEALRRHVKKLTGFDVDCYAVIELDAFQRAVDALGGIWYDVPRRMYYEDGPVIDLQPGYQLLNGEQAMWLCRFRSGYVNGDLDRIEVQHDFLKAAADQFLQLGSIPNIPLVEKMANCQVQLVDSFGDTQGVAFLVRTQELFVVLDGQVNVAEELAKAEKDLAYLQKFLQGVRGKLSNERFVANAPAAVIETERKKEADALSKIESLEAQIEQLKKSE